MNTFSVYGNSFMLFDSYGLPLVMQMDFCEQKRFRVAVDMFVRVRRC
jgi:alanyl-tRNA synthetase